MMAVELNPSTTMGRRAKILARDHGPVGRVGLSGPCLLTLRRKSF